MTGTTDPEASEAARALRSALRDDLTAAMKARRRESLSALRTTVAAIENAEAVDDRDRSAETTGSEHIAGAGAGAGSTEAARRVLSLADLRAIVEAQVAERTVEAERYDAHGQPDAAERLRREARTLAGYLPNRAGPGARGGERAPEGLPAEHRGGHPSPGRTRP